MQNLKKGLSADIYKSNYALELSGKSNQLSFNYSRVTILDDKGTCLLFEPSQDAPAVLLVRRFIMSRKLPILVPCKWVDNELLVLSNTMFGGCFVHTSDSRFHAAHPIPIHDRTENAELWVSYERFIKMHNHYQDENIKGYGF